MAEAVEGPRRLAPHDPMNPEMHLVDEAMLDQVESKLAAALGQQIAGVVCLEPAYLLDEVTLDERRVPLERLDQGR